jgi:hypothetical protein
MQKPRDTKNESDLRDDLYSSAERFARSALRAFLQQDWPIFLLHASTALEQLTKAYLASLNQSLIAASDFDSLLHACGLGRHAQRPPRLMRTITVTTALERAGQLVPALKNLSKELGLLADVRNGVVHAGRVESSAAETVLVPFLKACDELLVAMGIARGHFWADLTEVVEARLSESAKAAEIRATEAVASARLEFEKRYAAMEPEVRGAVLKVILEGYRVEGHEQDLVNCPSCGEPALATGTVDVSWEADFDRDDFGETYIVGAYPSAVTFYPNRLECRTCGLRLDGLEELQAVGIERSWRIEDPDVDALRAAEAEAWAGFEPPD